LNCSKARKPRLATIRWPWSRAKTSPPRIWIGSKRKSPDASDGASGEPFVKLGAAGPVTDRSFVYGHAIFGVITRRRSEEHTSELQSLMRLSSAVFCSKQ